MGEAVKKGQTNNWEEGKVSPLCIGITPWGCIKGREDLTLDKPKENKMEEEPAEISLDLKQKMKKKGESAEVSLDLNHRHFLLVDDGSTGKFTTGTFRFSFESMLKGIHLRL